MPERADILVKVGDNQVWTTPDWQALHRTGQRIQHGEEMRTAAKAVLGQVKSDVSRALTVTSPYPRTPSAYTARTWRAWVDAFNTVAEVEIKADSIYAALGRLFRGWTGGEVYTDALNQLRSADRITSLATMSDAALDAERVSHNTGVYLDGDVIEVLTETDCAAFHDGYIRVGNEAAAAEWRRPGGGFQRPFTPTEERICYALHHPAIEQVEADLWSGAWVVAGKQLGRSPVRAAMFRADRISAVTEANVRDRTVRVAIRRDKPITSVWMETR